jgi:hypothetical protein
MEIGRDRQGGTVKEIQAGGRGGGDTGKLFDDLSTEVYATSRLQRRAL